MNTKILIFLLFSNLFGASEAHHGVYHGEGLSISYVIPFIGMLLSIAVLPLVAHHFWEKNYGKIAVFWALSFYVPFLIIEQQFAFASYEFFKVMLTEYFPFIILLFSLYTISGGILLKGTLVGSPKVNTIILTIGTCLASIMGTTGAAMLLIRPLIRANKRRKHKIHTMVFFIFLVANIGGSLTPLGDPPLFLGFLKGVDFFWTTTNMFFPMLTISIILLIVYYLLDANYYKKEGLKENNKDPIEKLAINGKINFIFLIGVIFAVLLSGTESLKWTLFNINAGAYVVEVLKGNFLRDLILIAMAMLSLIFTQNSYRTENGFTWHPIAEVAKLFIGIFITIIPALVILNNNQQLFQDMSFSLYFWLTGGLSSFLDNAPTYLVFFEAAGIPKAMAGFESNAFQQAVASNPVLNAKLLAISVGAVFMGANTYIGNAPNFMVKSIAEENGIKMPSFFGYMAWSLLILVPCFIIINLIFI
ncbi:MAG: sodium:proton antiporter [Candidatus Marinimicrobia bacterium]|nr:sodium:proton antiporter [Candidatus Neomarinimicrobiota bacterium]